MHLPTFTSLQFSAKGWRTLLKWGRLLAERVTRASPLTAHQALRHMPLPANVTVALVQSYHSFSKVGSSGFQSLVFFTSPDVRCSTHDQSKEKDLWLRLQHLLDMTSKSAYTGSATVVA